MYKVAVYITLYKDVDAIEKCLSCLNKQTFPIDRIFIVDNSPEQINSSSLKSEKIIIDFHPENIGIAEGLNIGINWAIENRYDFLWTFDHDSEPLSTTLEILLLYYEKLNRKESAIGIIAPLSLDVKSNQEVEGAIFSNYQFVPRSKYKNSNPRVFYQQEFYECDMVITSGALINLKAAKNVELPNKDLFIDSVDWDYCMKFKDNGYRIIVVTQALMHHNFGDFVKNRFKSNNKLTPVYSYSAMRHYYISRNHTFMETRLSQKSNYLHLSILHRIKSLVKTIAKITLYDSDQKLLKMWACFKGTFDGFIGRLGKTWYQ